MTYIPTISIEQLPICHTGRHRIIYDNKNIRTEMILLCEDTTCLIRCGFKNTHRAKNKEITLKK